MELPIAFAERMKTLLGAEYDAFYEAYCRESAVKGLRVNGAKAEAELFSLHSPFPLERLSYVDGGFIVPETAEAGKHPYHHAGVYYMQDPGAMAAVAAIPDEVFDTEGMRVLDLCAAPGGKTTQLASRVLPRGGAVLSNEYNAQRSRILAGNVERMGLSNVAVTNLDSKYLAEWYGGFFDLVVCDAPCSGEGMFRKNDRAVEEWSESNVTMCAARQREILGNGAKCVAPGGYLLYSTCTYSVEENEAVVAAFLSEHPDFSLVSCAPAVVSCTSDGVTDGFGEDFSRCRRFYPHVSRGEGQFAALLYRDGNARVRADSVKDSFSPLGKSDRAAVEAFLSETLGHSLAGIGLCGGNAVALPEREKVKFPLPPFGLVSYGAVIGEVRKGRIVPHHHFFMAYGGAMKNRIVLEPTDEAVRHYLAGEEIAVPQSLSGYTAVLLRIGDTAVTLGGGKASCGRLKNYYPKGLRVR